MIINIDNKFCDKCKLHKVSPDNPPILMRGDANSKLLIIGDNPTIFDSNNNNIFIGNHGQNLQKRLNAFGIDCYFTNAVCCPVGKKKKAKKATAVELKSCKVFTLKAIEEIKPKVILATGKLAMSQLFNITLPTEVIRGKIFYHPELDLYVVPTYDVSYVSAKGDSLLYSQFNRDLELANSLAHSECTRKPLMQLRSLSDPKDINNYLESLLNKEVITFDLETKSKYLNGKKDDALDPKRAIISDISFSSEIGEGVHMLWEHAKPFKDLLQEVLGNDSIKNGHNVKFDCKMLRHNGYKVNNVDFDTMLAYHTLNMEYESGKGSKLLKLKVMAWFLTSEGGYEEILAADGGIAGAQGIVKAKTKKQISDEGRAAKWIDKTIGKGIEATVKLLLKKFKFDWLVEFSEAISISEDIMNALVEEDKNIKEAAILPLPVRVTQASIDREILDEELDRLFFSIDNLRNERMKKTGLEGVPYYSAMDSAVTHIIYTKLKPLIDRDFKEVFYDLIMPLSYTTMVMESNGLKIDRPYLGKVKESNNKSVIQIKDEFMKKIGREINLASSQQLSALMYGPKAEGGLGIKVNDRFLTPKKAPSTNVAAITHFSEKNPILKKIVEYRGLEKQTSTYIDGFINSADPETDRVHASYLQHGTATGRLSCISPPVQTIPKDNKIRNMIIPRKGNRLIAADLSQAELRVLAMLANDTAMIEAFLSGKDLHTITACSALLKIPYEDYDPNNKKHLEARQYSKIINFGIVYGMTGYTLAIRLGFPMETKEERRASMKKADHYINSWFSLYSGARAWLDAIHNFARKNGYVETIYGRRRYIPSVWSSVEKISEGGLRQAGNMPVQSTASDITCFGMIKIQKFLDENPQYNTQLVAVIHDCIILDSPIEENEFMSIKLVESMTIDMPKISIPLVADVDILEKWEK